MFLCVDDIECVGACDIESMCVCLSDKDNST